MIDEESKEHVLGARRWRFTQLELEIASRETK
jgi:hypothetical protein